MLPRVIVYDPELTASLPRDLAVASGLNALAHCVDSLWAPHRDPINAALATEGARCLASGMRALVRDDADPAGREQTLLGTYLAAAAFASAGSGLHHKICHVLGGTYGLPHAQTHAIVLPYVTAFTIPFAPDAAQRLRSASRSRTPSSGSSIFVETSARPSPCGTTDSVGRTSAMRQSSFCRSSRLRIPVP